MRCMLFCAYIIMDFGISQSNFRHNCLIFNRLQIFLHLRGIVVPKKIPVFFAEHYTIRPFFAKILWWRHPERRG